MIKIDLTEFSKRLIEKGKKHQAKRDAVTGNDIVFTIPPYEQKAMNEWLAEHNKTCSMRFDKSGNPEPFPGGAIGGLLTYQFTPTGIGMATTVKCACGEEVNITDYDSW